MVFHRDSCVESAVFFSPWAREESNRLPIGWPIRCHCFNSRHGHRRYTSAIDLVHWTDWDSGSTLPLLLKKNLLLAMFFFFACIMTLPITTKSRPDTPTQAIKIHDNLYNKYWGNFVSYHICLIIVLWFGKNLFHPCKIGLRDIIKKNPRLLHIWLSVFLKQNK